MVEYMRKIGDKTFELAKEKLADIFPQFHSHINNPCPELTLDSDDDDDSQLNMYMDDEELQSHIKSMKEKNQKLKNDIHAYWRRTVVLGFNSTKYDLNLIKSHLAKELDMRASGQKFTVKRINSYACLAKDAFK